MVMGRWQTHNRLYGFIGFMMAVVIFSALVGLSGCTKAQSTLPETSPVNAAKRRVLLKRWRALAKHSRAILVRDNVSPKDVQKLAATIAQFEVDRLEPPSVALPSRERHALDGLKEKIKRIRRGAVKPIAKMRRRHHNGPRFQWPLPTVQVLSKFGLRVDPFDRDRRTFHNGVDLKASKGTPVRPCDAGRVVEAGWRGDGCGLGVTVEHSGGFVSDYCHLSKISTQVGQYLHRDAILGEVGNTGRSTGYHLHWGIWRGGRAQTLWN